MKRTLRDLRTEYLLVVNIDKDVGTVILLSIQGKHMYAWIMSKYRT